MQLFAPFVGYSFAEPSDDRDATIVLPTAKSFATRPMDITGRREKTVYIYSDKALAFNAYIIPYKGAPQTSWLLLKTGLTVNANDPFIFFSNDVMPFIGIKVTNNSGAPATIKGWLFAQ